MEIFRTCRCAHQNYLIKNRFCKGKKWKGELLVIKSYAFEVGVAIPNSLIKEFVL